MTAYVADLDQSLLQLSPDDAFTLRDACEGVHVFGGIGSGKTSGSGKALAAAYLRAGMGGLVLCAKPEEAELWQSYAREHGRADWVVVFDARGGFNFIAYELERQGMEGINSVTECLMRVLEAADHATGTASGASSDPFWAQAVRQVLNHAIPVIYAARGTVSIETILRFVTSAASRAELYVDPAFAANSYAAQTLRQLVDAPALRLSDDLHEALLQYWLGEYPAVPEKTRGNIVISLSAKLDRFRHGRMRSCFCADTNIVPEITFHGALIIMAMPPLGDWKEDGIVAQQLFKFMWQRAVEARNGLDPVHRARPVFLWADEAQYFVNAKDDDFLSTCRGSKACVVYLTQTLPTYYARLGHNQTHAADGLIGKFGTKIFHQNACSKTNEFASKLIGRGLQYRVTEGRSSGSNRSEGQHFTFGSNEGTSWSQAEHMDNIYEPRFFAHALKAGGPLNGNRVTALWFKAGGQFGAADGSNSLVVTFAQ